MQKTLSIVLVVTIFSLVLNGFVRRSGVVDNTLTDKNSSEYRQNKRIEEFSSSDPLFFIYRPGRKLAVKDLEKVLKFSQALEEFPWGKERVAGPANVPLIEVSSDEYGYRAISFDPAITLEAIQKLKNKELSWEAWQKKIEESQVNNRAFFSFDWYDPIIIVPVLLAPNFSQYQVYWDTVELLEDRKISLFKRYFYNGLKPHGEWQDWQVAGWALAREALDISLTKDTLTLIPLGFVLAFILGVWSLKSIRKSVVMVIQMLLVFLWTRGSVAIFSWLSTTLELHWPGLPTTENIYVLVGSIIWFVQSSSFFIHRFHAFEKDGNWQGKEIKRLLSWLTVISVLSLLSLITFKNARVIREIGVLSALGIGYIFLVTIFVQPALYQFFAGQATENKKIKTIPKHARLKIWSLKLDQLLTSSILVRCLIITLFLVVVVMALYSLSSKKISINTKALAFIQGTDMYKTMTWLKEDNRFGNEALEVGVEADISDMAVFQRVYGFSLALEKLSGVTNTISIVKVILDLNQGKVPLDLGRLVSSLLDIEDSGISPVLLRDLRLKSVGQGVSTEAVKVLVFTNSRANESQELYTFIQEIRELGARHKLRLFLGGKSVTWVIQERCIREGKIVNTGIDIFLAIAWCSLFIFSLNARKTRQGYCVPWKMSLIFVAPLIFASAMVINTLVWFKIDFNQAVAVIMAFTINAAADFMFFPIAKLVELQRPGKCVSKEAIRKNIIATMQVTGRVVDSDALVNIVLFLPLVLARFEPIREIGIITALMLGATAFGVRVITPCFLAWGVKSKNR